MFKNREAAGRRLAEEIAALGLADPVILALPRGGTPVAAAIARRLGAPLDIVLVRKLGAPHQPELAVGAIVDGDVLDVVLNDDVVSALALPQSYIDHAVQAAQAEIEDRRRRYAAERPRVSCEGRTAVIVDDGLATGATMRAAVQGVRRRCPAAIVVAVPVAARETLAMMERYADRVVCLEAPEPFHAISQFYRHFEQVDENTVIDLLAAAAPRA